MDNYLTANPDKYHVLLSETSETQLIVQNISIAIVQEPVTEVLTPFLTKGLTT